MFVDGTAETGDGRHRDTVDANSSTGRVRWNGHFRTRPRKRWSRRKEENRYLTCLWHGITTLRRMFTLRCAALQCGDWYVEPNPREMDLVNEFLFELDAVARKPFGATRSRSADEFRSFVVYPRLVT